jgi:hypothetical protein
MTTIKNLLDEERKTNEFNRLFKAKVQFNSSMIFFFLHFPFKKQKKMEIEKTKEINL